MSTSTLLSSQRSFWVPVLCGAVILTIGIGARQSFGIFQTPISADLGVGRELWSFGNALSMLIMGLFSPFVGNVADRFGTARTVAVGGILYVTGMLMMAAATEGVLLTLGNALTGIAMAAAGFGPIFGVITRQTPPAQRSMALGVATAGGSFGQFAVVPFVSVLQDRLGDWHATMLVLGLVSAIMVPLTLGLREIRAPKQAGAAPEQSSREALREAFGTPGFWLLTFGFFVCGFHVAFVGLHLPAYISDKAVGLQAFGVTLSPLALGGWAIGLVGLFNIAGSLLWAWLGGRHKRKDMLTLLYLLRGLVFVLFLALPLSAASVLAFAAALGFLWLGTVPLTSGLVGYLFGAKYMATLYGIVFLSHQVGSFLGGWGAGRLYDINGNYDLMWGVSIGLALVAALVNWPIREIPVARLAIQPAE
ncbi:MFS transporter [Methylobacterium iners]|uniref:MFS-type transporter YhjX n=1 Tax=Methylobacterium iners TaxID=418707 RepID=A0ABQ4RYX6_9HYPH|nr:MFS transporter [Methylobacterium iners]GJD96050.1 putative MFS-type transporter YhjX [Methylobacterium iners]